MAGFADFLSDFGINLEFATHATTSEDITGQFYNITSVLLPVQFFVQFVPLLILKLRNFMPRCLICPVDCKSLNKLHFCFVILSLLCLVTGHSAAGIRFQFFHLSVS